jgi:hypothetical protein
MLWERFRGAWGHMGGSMTRTGYGGLPTGPTRAMKRPKTARFVVFGWLAALHLFIACFRTLLSGPHRVVQRLGIARQVWCHRVPPRSQPDELLARRSLGQLHARKPSGVSRSFSAFRQSLSATQHHAASCREPRYPRPTAYWLTSGPSPQRVRADPPTLAYC